MVRYFTQDAGKVVELDAPYQRGWAHLCPPFDEGELAAFARTHHIPLDFLSDSLDIDERSRYEREEEVRLILINSPIENALVVEDNDAMYVTAPIGIVLTPDLTVTITSAKETILQLFVDERIRAFDPSDQAGFVLRILEQNVFRFTTYLRNLNSDLFEDIIIDNSQALEMSNIYTNILGGTMDAYSSIISNNLNVVIQRLTFITIVLAVPTLVASLFGMNVDLPFSKEPWAFGVIIGISILFSLLLVWYFQRKKLF